MMMVYPTAEEAPPMTSRQRPLLRLRLRGGKYEEGEIPLRDLAEIARHTQLVVRRLGSALVARPGPGRPTSAIEQATELLLVGLTKGSTVLEIAGADPHADALELEDMPGDLGERALQLFVEGVTALSEERPDMPFGFDESAKKTVGDWLRRIRKFEQVGVSLRAGAYSIGAEIQPNAARRRLETVQVQPHAPFVTATQQAVEGVLYALNIHTGTYAIQDDSGQRLRLAVPDDIRAEAAMLITRRVRAVGNAEMDERGRLKSFAVSSLRYAPSLEGLEQGAFFERHELPASSVPIDDLGEWVIEGLTQEEADDFLS